MEIEEAFTQEAIETFDTNVEGEDEHYVRDMIRKIYEAHEMTHDLGHASVAILSFVAGRTYQAALDKEQSAFLMPMDQAMMAEFIGFLVQKNGATE